MLKPTGGNFSPSKLKNFAFASFFFLNLFISGCTKFLLLHRLFSSCSARASHCSDFYCCRAWVLGHTGFSSHGTWAQQLGLPGSRARNTQYLWGMGLVAPQYVGSSWIRDWTHVSCIGRWTLHH